MTFSTPLVRAGRNTVEEGELKIHVGGKLRLHERAEGIEFDDGRVTGDVLESGGESRAVKVEGGEMLVQERPGAFGFDGNGAGGESAKVGFRPLSGVEITEGCVVR